MYDTLRHTAELTGATVNQFLIQSALKEAEAVIECERMLRLSRRDCEKLLDLLEDTDFQRQIGRHEALPHNQTRPCAFCL